MGLATELWRGLGPAIDNIVTRLSEWIEKNEYWLRPAALEWGKRIGDALTQLAEDFKKLTEGKEVGGFIGKVIEVGKAANDTANFFGGWGKSIKLLAEIWIGAKVVGMLANMAKLLEVALALTRITPSAGLLGAVARWIGIGGAATVGAAVTGTYLGATVGKNSIASQEQEDDLIRQQREAENERRKAAGLEPLAFHQGTPATAADVAKAKQLEQDEAVKAQKDAARDQTDAADKLKDAADALKDLADPGGGNAEDVVPSVAPERASLWERLTGGKNPQRGQQDTAGSSSTYTPGGGWGKPGPLPPPIQTTPLTTKSGVRLNVAPEYADKFKGFLDELESTGYKINSGGGYNRRMIGNTDMPSAHAFGAAIDLNEGANPQGAGGKQYLPPNIAEIAHRWGLTWGGQWSGKSRDPMHFEIGSQADVAANRKMTGWDANNPMNLTPGAAWQGPRARTAGGLPIRVYDSMEEGVADSVRKLMEYQKDLHLQTVDQMARRWNATATPEYVDRIAAELGVGKNQPFDFSDPEKAAAWIRAAQPQETGPGRLTPAQIAAGVSKGLGGGSSATRSPRPVGPSQEAVDTLAGSNAARRDAWATSLPVPVGASAAAQGWQMSNDNSSSTDRSNTTHIAALHVHSAADNAAGIANDIHRELKRYDYVTQSDTGLA